MPFEIRKMQTDNENEFLGKFSRAAEKRDKTLF
jgi:hypothetical protein